jgi:hypothetical protein
MGRPTKYDPAFCEQVVPFMSQGYSIAALAGHLGVSRTAILDWARDHEDFSCALSEGKAASALWWENCIRNNALSGQGNSTSSIFGLKNRAPEEWRDRTAVDLTSSDGSMKPTTIIAAMTPQEAAEAYAATLNPDKE